MPRQRSATRSKRSDRIAWLIVAAPLVALAIYYLHTAIWGPEGYLALKDLRAEITAAEAELAAVRSERERHEDRARRLRSDSIDLDLLNERVREVLGYARSDELILLTPSAN